MKMQIVSCPRCGTFVLDDTAQCHGCGHILDQDTANELKRRALPTDGAVRDDMESCPSCGETCRTGLVRCWNCSTFLRPEIEASYRRMKEQGKYEIEFIDLPVIDASSVTEEDSLRGRVATPESFLAAHAYSSQGDDDDDFELSEETQFGVVDEDNFELGDQFALTDQSVESSSMDELPSADESDSYQIQAPASGKKTPIEIAVVPDLEGAIPLLQTDESIPPVQNETSVPPVRSEASEPPVRDVAETPASAEDHADKELLEIANAEEKDIERVRKTQRSKDTFLIYCPQGCRIRVKERHRGKSGKCPRCQSEFVVPRKPVVKKEEGGAAANPIESSRFKKWLNDIRLHTVDPQKLRIKADSLFNECQPIDLGFSAEDLLFATLIVGKFGANAKKVPPVRQAMIEHFFKQGTVDTLAVAAKKIYTKDQIAQFTVAQPAPAGTESLFGDIPVFGINRIAVRIPRSADDSHPKYLSFSLSEFRAFAAALQEVCEVTGLAANAAIPMTDEYATRKCHLSQANVLELAQVNYYEKDPAFKLEFSGWKCAACGIIVSEAARAEAKLGGANGKAIAKAKCPKCSQKFGYLPLYKLVGAGTEQPAVEQPAEPAMA